ncbi:MAG TPA: cytochrome-c peroxidase, partial [Polymorphobacter sp.]|nr:cytochrome-c peroxidase [Polymorphobacter sp.]
MILAASIGLLVASCNKPPEKSTSETEAPGVAAPDASAPTDPLILQAREVFQPIPTKPPALPGNPATAEKIALGEMLYFEPRLSATHSISCASCHNLGLGGADDSPASAGFHGTRGNRNAPTVYNAVFNFAQFWDGR